MTAEERLVESGNVSTPWSYHQEDDNLFGGSVVSRSWMYGDKGVYPYEFGYNSQFERTYPGLPANNESLEETTNSNSGYSTCPDKKHEMNHS